MEDRLKSLFDEILLTLRDNTKAAGIDPLKYVEDEAARWASARETDEGIWFCLLLQMLRYGFPNYEYTFELQPVLKEHLGDFAMLAELDEKGKAKLAELELLDLNLQRVRSIAKNARTMIMLQRDFGSVVELIESFETEEDLAAGIEEMFSYIKGPAATEFAREVGWKKPGSSSSVRRVISRMKDLVDGSLDTEGIKNALTGMGKVTGYSPEIVDFVLELFASGDDQVGMQAICDVNFACYRCRVSDEQCDERRYRFGSAEEIVREEQE